MPKLESPVEPSIRRSGRRGRTARVHTSLAEINVVPLVDVMLVLLVIFMVTAPMMQQGYAVNLPHSNQSKALPSEPISITVPATFHRDGHVQINDKRITFEALDNQIRQALESNASRTVIVRGDGTVLYEDLMRVVDELTRAGVRTVNLATQPVVR